MKKVFIDGSAGTTGLRIAERLSKRSDIELMSISEELRKDSCARSDMINSADIVFLCLPDDAAREAALTEERAAMLDMMMEQLPEVQRQAVQMRYIEQVSHEEMQRRLHMSSSNVYTTISRALSALKAMSHGR